MSIKAVLLLFICPLIAPFRGTKMNRNAKLLVVDDEPLNLSIMREFLEESYENIEYANDGMECLEKIKVNQPDIIFLDVSMPKMDGYEVCRKIKNDPEYSHIIVIFVTARGTSEERMKGFDAGGDDYIVKPFQEVELINKLGLVIKYKQEKSELNEQLQSMQNVAFDVMTGNAEIGYVIQYLQTLFVSTCIDQIINATLDFTRTLELNVCLKIGLPHDIMYRTSTGKISPLEYEIIELLSGKGRIFSFEQRCQFNYPFISLLVKNMPTDEMKYGRVIDLIPTAMEGANNCIQALGFKNRETEINKNISETISQIEDIQKQVKKNIDLIATNNNQAMSVLYKTMENNLPSMGLEDDQEELITHAIDAVALSVTDSISYLTIVDSDVDKIKTLIQQNVNVGLDNS